MAGKRKVRVDEDESGSHWATLTVTQLKAELKRLDLPVTGKKADLIERLENYDDDEEDVYQNQDEEAIESHWQSLTIPALKAELTRLGLPTNGVKAELVERLEALDKEVEDQDDEEDATSPGHGFSKFTDVRLKVECHQRGLSSVGDRAALLQRLNDLKDGKDVVRDTGSLSSGETRLRPFIQEPDAEHIKKLAKAHKERMFMLDRSQGSDRNGPCETFDIAGSKGNIYKTTIGMLPKCTCPDAIFKGNRCKHILYALVIILKAPKHLCYQNAFLSSEIDSILASAPITRLPSTAAAHSHDEGIYAGKRKPIEGECPICVFDMEPTENLVWCKAACGQNFHKQCFEQWRASKKGGKVTCVYCRSEWQEDATPAALPASSGSNSLANLKDIAPKIGSYHNVANLMPEYARDYEYAGHIQED